MSEDIEDRPNGEEDDFDQVVELTPEQAAALKRSIEAFRQSLLPDLQAINFAVSEATLNNILSISRAAEAQQALIANSIKPFLDAQAAWQKQFVNVSSDIFKSYALAQTNLNSIVAQLTKSIDFSGLAAASEAAARFAAQQSAWLADITPTIASMYASFYPPNLRAIARLRFEDVEKVVMADGIPLYGLPRASIAGAIVHADSAGERRKILGNRWQSISTDCRDIVLDLESEALTSYRRFALAALDALDAGHAEAAQALAGSLVDAILSSYFGKSRIDYTPDRRGRRTKDAYDQFSVRQFIAFAPMWQAYQQFFVTDGDTVPRTFSRNATAHTVSSRQFSRRNAVQGLMLACSLMYRLEEEQRDA